MAPELGRRGMKSAEDIVSLYMQRLSTRGAYLNRMKEVSANYNNEVAVPLPELDINEKPAVANLLAQGSTSSPSALPRSCQTSSTQPFVAVSRDRRNVPASAALPPLAGTT